jgi:hypothetical protein
MFGGAHFSFFGGVSCSQQIRSRFCWTCFQKQKTKQKQKKHTYHDFRSTTRKRRLLCRPLRSVPRVSPSARPWSPPALMSRASSPGGRRLLPGVLLRRCPDWCPDVDATSHDVRPTSRNGAVDHEERCSQIRLFSYNDTRAWHSPSVNSPPVTATGSQADCELHQVLLRKRLDRLVWMELRWS